MPYKIGQRRQLTIIMSSGRLKTGVSRNTGPPLLDVSSNLPASQPHPIPSTLPINLYTSRPSPLPDAPRHLPSILYRFCYNLMQFIPTLNAQTSPHLYLNHSLPSHLTPSSLTNSTNSTPQTSSLPLSQKNRFLGSIACAGFPVHGNAPA